MKTSRHDLRRTILGLAVAGAFAPVLSPAYAQEDPEVTALKRPDSSASLGAGLVTGNPRDRSIWGQYNGLREHDANLLIDLDYVNRNDATGMWTTLRGRNLGLDSRDAAFTLQRQGDWRFALDYGELVHREIRTINTGMLGAGSTTPTIVRISPPGSGSDIDLELKRKALGLAGDKWIGANLQLEVSFRNEDKDGARLWARGYDCASFVCSTTQNAGNTRWALIPVPEPVSFNTKQVEAKLNYSGEKLFVSGGYYGSFFTSDNGNVAPIVPAQLNGPTGVLTPLSPAAGATGTSLQNVLQLPMALAPDNQAHQFYVSGNYAWTPRTRSTFKVAYTHATQNESYSAMGFTGLPAVTRNDLGGEVNTTLMQLGLTARPIDRLSLLGNLRYEKKNDKTPIALYNVENVGAAETRWNNSHITNRRIGGKLEAGYRLPANVRATAGIDYEQVKRELPGLDVEIAGLSGLRGETEEITYRAELRRSISETLTGAVGVAHAKRTGSDWFSLIAATYGRILTHDQIFTRTGTFPYNLADRERDKVKLSADWQPMDRLSLQFAAEAGRDKYTPPSENGLRQGDMSLLSVDGSFALTERWKLTAYGSVGTQKMNEADRANYIADTNNRSTAFGVGVSGSPSGVLEVGAGVSYVRDVTKYALSPDVATSANNVLQNAVGLPDTKFSEARYGVFAKYALNKKSDVRLDVARIVSKLDEWSWGYNGVPFVYSDGTTITLNPEQKVTFLGARYIYKF